MTLIQKVRSSRTEIPKLEINVDTVYLRSNIHEIENKEGYKEWEYTEKQMNILEYLKEIVPQNQEITDTAVSELSILFSAYQSQVDSAIAELSMLIAGGV